MGLDMYLSASKYVGGWEHDGEEQRATFIKIVEAAGLTADVVAEGAPALDVKVNIGYWRKANAIHNWFVRNTQDDKDECQPSYVSRGQLAELKLMCENAITSKDTSGLKPKVGFFFGNYTIDTYYWEDLNYTIEVINKCLALDDSYGFEYRASW